MRQHNAFINFIFVQSRNTRRVRCRVDTLLVCLTIFSSDIKNHYIVYSDDVQEPTQDVYPEARERRCLLSADRPAPLRMRASHVDLLLFPAFYSVRIRRDTGEKLETRTGFHHDMLGTD